MRESAAGRILEALPGLLWPRCCEACGAPSEEPVCETCRLAMPVRTAAGCCSLCGKTLLDGEADIVAAIAGARCHLCREEPPAFDLARSAVAFRGPARTLVHTLKYRGAPWLADELAFWLHGCYLAHFAGERPDFVAPVPMQATRRLRRGYNQARLLAQALAHRLDLPCEDGAILRVRQPGSQTLLDAKARRKNVRGAFEAAPGARRTASGKCVLLVDDVMTTGATFDAAARAFRAAGAERVLCLSFARD